MDSLRRPDQGSDGDEGRGSECGGGEGLEPLSAAAASTGELSVTVRAEISDGGVKVWIQDISRTAPLSQLVSTWAEHHGVPPEAVGLESSVDLCVCVLDQTKTPEELGWSGLTSILLFAYPLDSSLAEEEPAVGA